MDWLDAFYLVMLIGCTAVICLLTLLGRSSMRRAGAMAEKAEMEARRAESAAELAQFSLRQVQRVARQVRDNIRTVMCPNCHADPMVCDAHGCGGRRALGWRSNPEAELVVPDGG